MNESHVVELKAPAGDALSKRLKVRGQLWRRPLRRKWPSCWPSTRGKPWAENGL